MPPLAHARGHRGEVTTILIVRWAAIPMLGPMLRREFLQWGALGCAAPLLSRAAEKVPEVMTVRGLRPAADLGFVLPHEHVLVDFIGAAEVSASRYDAGVALAKIKPFVEEAKALGCATMMECTPAFLGRDPRMLARLSEATEVQFLTNTGYYAARQHKFLPAHAFTEDADALAARWQREWREGIDGTGVRPGFIKLGFDAGDLSEVAQKLVRAAARTHRASGLTIAAHTGDDAAALAQIALLGEEKVAPAAWIWVHAQNARREDTLATLARAGAWLSFDGIAPRSLARHVQLVTAMKRQGLLERVLISHDAGWYRPGEPDGGAYRGYDVLFRAFLPALKKEGFSAEEIRQLTVTNPARAFAIRPRLG